MIFCTAGSSGSAASTGTKRTVKVPGCSAVAWAWVASCSRRATSSCRRASSSRLRSGDRPERPELALEQLEPLSLRLELALDVPLAARELDGPASGPGLTSTRSTERPRLWTCATGTEPTEEPAVVPLRPHGLRRLRGDHQVDALRRLGSGRRGAEEPEHEARPALADLRRSLGQLGRGRPRHHAQLPASGVEQAGLSWPELGQPERATEVGPQRVVERAAELGADPHRAEGVGDGLCPAPLAHRLVGGEAGALEERIARVHEHRRNSGGAGLADDGRGLPQTSPHRLAAAAGRDLSAQVGGDEGHEARGGRRAAELAAAGALPDSGAGAGREQCGCNEDRAELQSSVRGRTGPSTTPARTHASR